MKIYTASFDGVWHDGIAVVVARNKKDGAAKLAQEIASHYKRTGCNARTGFSITPVITPESLTELNPSKSAVMILDDGDE